MRENDFPALILDSVKERFTVRTVNGNTLALVIQAVDFKIRALEKNLDELPEEQGAELESLLLAYENAAEILKHFYQETCIEEDNLTTYENLLGDADRG